jgi:hypothetical protein
MQKADDEYYGHYENIKAVSKNKSNLFNLAAKEYKSLKCIDRTNDEDEALPKYTDYIEIIEIKII